jgi:formate dehydrogenase maturation protein FdhE
LIRRTRAHQEAREARATAIGLVTRRVSLYSARRQSDRSGGSRIDWMLFMNNASDSAERSAANTCQVCGSKDVHHRSLLRVGDEQEGRLVLLCEACHQERLDAED